MWMLLASSYFVRDERTALVHSVRHMGQPTGESCDDDKHRREAKLERAATTGSAHERHRERLLRGPDSINARHGLGPADDGRFRSHHEDFHAAVELPVFAIFVVRDGLLASIARYAKLLLAHAAVPEVIGDGQSGRH